MTEQCSIEVATISGPTIEVELIGGGSDNAKADKVLLATAGNFAGLDSGGNLTDSGHKAEDFLGVELRGAANGLAELDSNGLVPTAQLPPLSALRKYSAVNPELRPVSGLASWQITHNLNCRDLMVEVALAAAPYSKVLADVAVDSADSVTIFLATGTTVLAATYNVTIVG